jgi:hypothetical protein
LKFLRLARSGEKLVCSFFNFWLRNSPKFTCLCGASLGRHSLLVAGSY